MLIIKCTIKHKTLSLMKSTAKEDCSVRDKRDSSFHTMFKKAVLYGASNSLQKRDAQQALERFFHLLHWQEGERILDVGSGAGNVTNQVLVPQLPPNYKQLVGIDLSENMVKYANENNDDPRISFLVADIVETDFMKLKSVFDKGGIAVGFDKIFSFHCVHWTKNYPQWAKNMCSLLSSGGQLFLMFCTYSCFTDLWIEAAFSEKWLSYMKKVTPFKYEYHDSNDIQGDIGKLMSNAGFVVESCVHYQCRLSFNTSDKIRAAMEAADPYVHHFPSHLQSEYMDDVMQVASKYNDRFGGTGLPYTIVVVVASKPKE